MLHLLQSASKARGKDYTVNLITSQVVPSYEDMTIPAVRQYRDMMDRYNPSPPSHLVTTPPQSPQYSFISFEGFLNAKLLTEILHGVGEPLSRTSLKAFVETVRSFDIGVSNVVSLGPERRQGLDDVYYTTVHDDHFVPLTDWQRWQR